MPAEQKENPLTKINNDIKNRTFCPAYLLYGEEAYLVQQTKKKLKNAIVAEGDSMNFSYFSGKDINISEIIDSAETMPFFADYRLIMIEDSGIFKTAGDKMADYLETIPETTIFVFVETEVDTRLKSFKALKKNGYPAKFERQTQDTLNRWVLSKVKKEGKQISQATLERFFELTGDDMENIDCELEKLFCYTLEKDSISLEDVNAICADLASDHIFEMTEAIARKDAAKALALYSELKVLETPAPQILAMISGQFRRLLSIREMKKAGLDNRTIAEKLGFKSDYAVRKNLPIANQFTVEELRKNVQLCLEAETSFKTGKITDTLATETLIFSLLKL